MSAQILEPKSYVEKQQLAVTRYTKVIESAAKKVPAKWQLYVSKVAPALAYVCVFISIMLPLYYKLFVKLYDLYCVLPHNILCAIYGFALCFFGGSFSTLIAAIETFKLSGWDSSYPHLMQLWKEKDLVLVANKKDDEVDDNKDGIPDVNQIEGDELLKRKLKLVLRTADPEKANAALGGIYMACLGVVAALKLRFAKTIMLSVSMANLAKKPTTKVLTPILKELVPLEYQKWVHLGIDYGCKMLAMSFAWWIQRVVSAVHSALKGGHLVAHSIMNYLREKDIINMDPDQSFLDEILGWTLGAIGIYVQLSMGFALIFPLNLFLLPFSFSNYAIEWIVSN
mmetsp:Transcript_11952/g.16207  ORF Transcript_11952/g.16207 Transcript_11952/m.16207 type:complete len:340 (+) Transcript_11952:94-1113(+)|eukprot:CAMPEP_0196582302 /NCGR_PEP_ID=MMETSP1081-20130531/38541_1 /TAXON_ID=36882 /ORGANISM="Pyramimonas amylifera, Strain CCMP720" /LENGTH=339 /DNA_ID=CAMNT_0041902827 /DNA_START=89 /DNA_END=1108 /DNA_ORIENTATION=-